MKANTTSTDWRNGVQRKGGTDTHTHGCHASLHSGPITAGEEVFLSQVEQGAQRVCKSWEGWQVQSEILLSGLSKKSSYVRRSQ